MDDRHSLAPAYRTMLSGSNERLGLRGAEIRIGVASPPSKP